MGDSGIDRWQIPKKAHADIIGRGGDVAKELRGLGVRVDIPSRDDPSRTVVVEGGPDERRAAKALMERYLGWPISDKPLGLLVVQIPQHLVGRIVGPKASTLNELERKHGCNIHVPKRDERSEAVELEGPAEALRPLKADIESRINADVEVLQEVVPDGADVALPGYAGPPIDFSPETAGEIAEALFFEEGLERDLFERFLDYLRSAVRTIDIAIFNLTHDAIAHVLITACKRGVTVRLLTDDLQARSQGSDIERLGAEGVNVRTDHREDRHMHHKFCVLDGECMITGSFNWTRAACEENDENVLVTNHAGLVAQYAAQFEKLWAKYGPAGKRG